MQCSLATCPKCGALFDAGAVRHGGALRCAICGTSSLLEVFPSALNETFSPVHPDLSVNAEDAVCFFHPTHRADNACHLCGRIVCRLCALLVGEQVFCPRCLHREAAARPDSPLRTHYMRYDKMALAIALLPFTAMWASLPAFFLDTGVGLGIGLAILMTTSFVLAPAALFLIFRYRKVTHRPVGRVLPRFAGALLLSVLQIGVWVVAITTAVLGIIFGGP